MDPISLLQVTLTEQRLAREATARRNLAVRERRDRTAGRTRTLLARFTGGAPAGTPACATC